MPLTALHRTVLESYRTFRESPLTVWRLMALASKSHAILFIIFSLLSIIWYLKVSESEAWLFAGIGAGCILRDVAHFRMRVRVWPVLTRVVDWQKIDDLLAGKEVVDPSDEEHVPSTDRA